MKGLRLAIFFGLLLLSFFAGCKKDVKPAVQECQVQEYGSNLGIWYNFQTTVVPYLFRKTFDSKGVVTGIDAYLQYFSGAIRVDGILEYKNKMIYILDRNNKDSLMTIWLNDAGKVTRAQDKSGIRYPQMIYDFTYNSKNELQEYTASYSYPVNSQTFRLSVEYDNNGNCTRFGDLHFTYDQTRTAKKQFYYDVDYYLPAWIGTKLLEFLNYFPEITSPKNIRIHTTAGGGAIYRFATEDLTNHQFDADGKLISYSAEGRRSIVWTCGASNPKQ